MLSESLKLVKSMLSALAADESLLVYHSKVEVMKESSRH